MSSSSNSSHLQPSPPQQNTKSPLTSRRSLRQLGLCFAGIGSIILSTIITRRAVARHHAAKHMKIFQQSNRAFVSDNKMSGGTPMAVEALQLATLNTASWAMMAVGGLSWALDVSSLDDLKRYARTHTRGDPDMTDEAVEEQFQAELVRLVSKHLSDSQVESLLRKAVQEKKMASAGKSKSQD